MVMGKERVKVKTGRREFDYFTVFPEKLPCERENWTKYVRVPVEADIKEYQNRRKNRDAFAEWFSIDPPFPDGIFGDEKLKAGAYVNGGIMPLVGGELSKAALEHGFESYGADILKRYFNMISSTGETSLWYFPDGSPCTKETSTSPEASSSDAWGSSAMLYAFIEGLCGIQDQAKVFKKIKIAPRWSVESDLFFHILLPDHSRVKSISAEGKQLDFKEKTIENSRYADFSMDKREKFFFKIHLRGEK
jgi:hypothetical protein